MSLSAEKSPFCSKGCHKARRARETRSALNPSLRLSYESQDSTGSSDVAQSVEGEKHELVNCLHRNSLGRTAGDQRMEQRVKEESS